MKIAGIDPTTQSGREEFKKQFPGYDISVLEDGGIKIMGRNLKESSLKSMLSEGDSLFNESNFNIMENQKAEPALLDKKTKIATTANTDIVKLLPQFIQLMDYRKSIAKDVLNANDEQDFSQGIGMYNSFNEQIKKLLGI